MFSESIVRFYIGGFREMTLGYTLWLIILVKLFIIFAVLKVFFFPDLWRDRAMPTAANMCCMN